MTENFPIVCPITYLSKLLSIYWSSVKSRTSNDSSEMRRRPTLNNLSILPRICGRSTNLRNYPERYLQSVIEDDIHHYQCQSFFSSSMGSELAHVDHRTRSM